MVYTTTTSLVSLVLLLSMNSQSMGQSIIDCNGLITCSNYDPWTEVNSVNHTIFGDCSINISFRYSKCCQTTCEYIIEITEVSSSNECDFTEESSVMNEAIKFAIMKLDMIANIQGAPNNFDIWVKSYSCYSESVPPGTLTPCGSECCVTKYSITKEAERLLVFNQINYLANSPQEFCNGTCSSIICNQSHALTFGELYYGDYSSDELCDLDCFWKLSGNSNATPNSFIGPTNDMPLHIKTVNNLIYLSPNGHPVMTLDGDGKSLVEISGKLFIATSGGTYNILPSDIRLAVGGKIIAEEVIVKLKANWPDYVFSENYDLIPLNKLESLIKERGALPGIPTAEEMQKDETIPLGEMNLKLLQKIEEMTLYLIELEKKNQGLEQRLQKLEGK